MNRQVNAAREKLTPALLDIHLSELCSRYPGKRAQNMTILLSPIQHHIFLDSGYDLRDYRYHGFDWQVSTGMLDDMVVAQLRGFDGHETTVIENIGQ